VADFAGAVLTGGASTRMGRDKALLPHGGSPLAVRVAHVLELAGAEAVVAVGGDLEGLRALGLTAIADPRQGQGPLAGIAAALQRVGTADIVAVLACDLPAASPIAVRAVVEALAADPAAHVAVPVVAGRIQPLHAAWRRSALPAVEAALDAGDGAVRFVLEALGATTVPGLDPAWFANANHPADLAPDLGP
jgi:molybdopterin-guanine dinucleotide biosynthesis protein A